MPKRLITPLTARALSSEIHKCRYLTGASIDSNVFMSLRRPHFPDPFFEMLSIEIDSLVGGLVILSMLEPLTLVRLCLKLLKMEPVDHGGVDDTRMIPAASVTTCTLPLPQ